MTLPLLPGADAVAVGGINDVGQVAGRVTRCAPACVSHAVLWTIVSGQPTITDLGTFGVGTVDVRDVNDAGQVVGIYFESGVQHGFVWTPSASGAPTGTLVDIGINVDAVAINNLGQVAGQALIAGSHHAFLWTASVLGGSSGTLVDLGTFGGASSRALDVNDFGQVVGESGTASGPFHAALWTVDASGGVSVLDLHPSGASQSTALSINNRGQVVGIRTGPELRSFFWAPGESATELTSLDGGCGPAPHLDLLLCSAALGINDLGEVAGLSLGGSTERATRWTVQVIPPTPVEQVEAIAGDVEALVTTGALSQGQGNSLTAKLDAATAQLNKGKTHAAINLLRAFINQCEAYVAAGMLTAAEGQALIDAAQNLIDELEGGS